MKDARFARAFIIFVHFFFALEKLLNDWRDFTGFSRVRPTSQVSLLRR